MNHNANGFIGVKPANSTWAPAMDLDSRAEQNSRYANQAHSDGARKIEQSIQYMMQHLNRPLQVSELAETAHTSQSHYFALFKRWVGLSPIDYFIRLRMKQACWLLTGSSMSVKEVAVTLGYDDPFYFSRVFKSVNGTAPTTYRIRQEELEAGQDQMAPPNLGDDLPRPRMPLAEAAEEGETDRRGQEPAKLLGTRWFSRQTEEKP